MTPASNTRYRGRPSRRRGPRWGRIAFVAALGLVVLVSLAWGAMAATSAAAGLFAADATVRRAVQLPEPSVVASPAPDAAAAADASASAAASPSAEPSASLEASPAGGADPVKAAALPYPDPPAVEPEVIRQLHPKEKLIAITLDDGLGYDERLLDLFEQHDVRLTTFLLGQAVAANPRFMKRIVADGFEIANHTWDHKDLTGLSTSAVVRELDRTQKRISEYTGNQAPYMRPPGGAFDSAVKRTAAEHGYKLVMWTKSFADTNKAATADTIYERVMTGLEPGQIILCHWGGTSTYEGMARVLPELERRGYRVVTVSELIAASNESR